MILIIDYTASREDSIGTQHGVHKNEHKAFVHKKFIYTYIYFRERERALTHASVEAKRQTLQEPENQSPQMINKGTHSNNQKQNLVCL